MKTYRNLFRAACLTLLMPVACAQTPARDDSQDAFEQMESTLAEARATSNDRTRIRLLREHLTMMQDKIQEMQAMGHGGMGGMDHGGGGMGGMNHGGGGMGGMGASSDQAAGPPTGYASGQLPGMDHSQHNMSGDGSAGGMGGMNHGEGGGMGGMNHGGGGMGGMNHGEGGGMGGMNHREGGGMGGMMQHHTDVVKMIEHVITTQQLLLDLLEKQD